MWCQKPVNKLQVNRLVIKLIHLREWRPGILTPFLSPGSPNGGNSVDLKTDDCSCSHYRNNLVAQPRPWLGLVLVNTSVIIRAWRNPFSRDGLPVSEEIPRGSNPVWGPVKAAGWGFSETLTPTWDEQAHWLTATDHPGHIFQLHTGTGTFLEDLVSTRRQV